MGSDRCYKHSHGAFHNMYVQKNLYVYLHYPFRKQSEDEEDIQDAYEVLTHNCKKVMGLCL